MKELLKDLKVQALEVACAVCDVTWQPTAKTNVYEIHGSRLLGSVLLHDTHASLNTVLRSERNVLIAVLAAYQRGKVMLALMELKNGL